MMDAFFVILSWFLVFGVSTGFVAARRRRNPWVWGLAGMLLPFAAFVPLMLLPLGRCSGCGQRLVALKPAALGADVVNANVCAICGNPLGGKSSRADRFRIAMAVALTILVPAGCIVQERTAERRARDFCAKATPGSPLAPLAEAAQADRDAAFRRVEANQLRVGYIGIPPFSRHICRITAQDGKVTGAELEHVD